MVISHLEDMAYAQAGKPHQCHLQIYTSKVSIMDSPINGAVVEYESQSDWLAHHVLTWRDNGGLVLDVASLAAVCDVG